MHNIRPQRSAMPASLPREQEPLLTAAAAATLFFLVGSFVFARIVRTSFLLQIPQALSNLPWLYAGSAILMLLLSSLYLTIERRARRDRLNSLCLVAFASCYSIMWHQLPTTSPTLLAGCYWMVEIIGNFTVLQAWSLFQQLFDSRQAKRCFPYITAAGAFSTVVFGFASPSLAHRLGTDQLLNLATLGLVMATLGTLWLGQQGQQLLQANVLSSPRRRQGLAMFLPSPRLHPLPPSQRRWLGLLGLPSLPWLMLVTCLMYACSTLLDFRFQTVLATAWHHPDERSAFLGWYYGITGLLICCSQLFLTPWWLQRVDIFFALLLLPFSLFVPFFAMGWFGHLIPYWTIIASKGAEQILRLALVDNVFQLLLLPLPSKWRGQVKTIVDGLCKPFAMGLTGLGLALTPKVFPHMPPSQWLSYSMFLAAGLTLAWACANWPLRQLYRQALIDSISKRRLPAESTPLELHDATTWKQLQHQLSHGTEQDQRHVLDVIAFCSPQIRQHLLPQLFPLLHAKQPQLRRQTLTTLANHWTKQPSTIPHVIPWLQDTDAGVRMAAILALSRWQPDILQDKLHDLLHDEAIEVRCLAISQLYQRQALPQTFDLQAFLSHVCRHPLWHVREQGALFIGQLAQPQWAAPLAQLLQDEHPKVSRAAILVAGQLKIPELLPKLLTCLQQDPLRNAAILAIGQYQQACRGAICQMLLTPDAPTPWRLRSMAAGAQCLATVAEPRHMDWLIEQAVHGQPSFRSAYLSGVIHYQQGHPHWRCPSLALGKLEEQILRELAHWQHRVNQCPPTMVLLQDGLHTRRQAGLYQLLQLIQLHHPHQPLEPLSPIVLGQATPQRANAIEWFSQWLKTPQRRRWLPWFEYAAGPEPSQWPQAIQPEAKSWQEELLDLLQHPDPWLRAITCYELAKQPLWPKALPWVELMIQDPDPLCREMALSTLAHWHPPHWQIYIQKGQQDRAHNVRSLAQFLATQSQAILPPTPS